MASKNNLLRAPTGTCESCAFASCLSASAARVCNDFKADNFDFSVRRFDRIELELGASPSLELPRMIELLPEIGDLVSVFSFHVYKPLVGVELNVVQASRLSWGHEPPLRHLSLDGGGVSYNDVVLKFFKSMWVTTRYGDGTTQRSKQHDHRKQKYGVSSTPKASSIVVMS